MSALARPLRIELRTLSEAVKADCTQMRKTSDGLSSLNPRAPSQRGTSLRIGHATFGNSFFWRAR